METRKNSGSAIGVPGAIIIAATILAIAYMWTQRPAHSGANTQLSSGQNALPNAGAAAAMEPVSASDHILGNPNADIKLVEYSDPSCPYCKLFNPTMQQIMTEYGPGGKVAWVYRQFPLDKADASGNVLHPNAGREAQALECAASLGGNTAFWAYEKKWFEVFPEDGADRSVETDNAQIASVAQSVGLDPVSFNDCIASGRFKAKLDKSFTDGINAGISGTPYTVLITPSGTKIPLVGAQTYQTLKSSIDALIKS
ncbi:MAG: oxidoreductase [Candidatus Parcubacteria bacterium]|nr:oxidoreductase [Candidatus Parcubacteria bacterium]